MANRATRSRPLAPAKSSGTNLRKPSAKPKVEHVFAPVRTRRVFEEICESIRDRISSGELKPGDRLPPERELAEMFRTSRTAVREALLSLQLAGTVELFKGRTGGAYVLEAGNSLVTQTFHDFLDFGKVSLSTLLEARSLILEPVARIACERATAKDIKDLERNVEELEEATRAGEVIARSHVVVEFYNILARATGNEVIAAIVDATSQVLREHIRARSPRVHKETLLLRQLILREFKRGNAEGASQTIRTYTARLNRHLIRENALSKDKLSRAQRIVAKSSSPGARALRERTRKTR